MRIFLQACVALSLLTMAPDSRAASKDIAETLNIVWESYWQQSGYPQRVFKWQGPIRVKFSGAYDDRQRAFALTQLRHVAGIAGIPVSEASQDTANLEIEFVRDNPVSKQESCRTNRKTSEGIIQSTKIKVGQANSRRCLLHESMHAMGFSGHPSGDSILSYFRKSNELTQIDEFLLRVLYSDQIKVDMYLFPALQIYAQRAIEAVPEGQARLEAEKTAMRFLREAVTQMESFALANGEPPRVVLRSSKSTTTGLEKGRTEAQYLVGLAYMFGDVVEVDKKKGFNMLARAASLSHGEAQLSLGDAYAQGAG